MSIACTHVPLVDEGSVVDLYVHHSRGKSIFQTNLTWLEEGRPRRLSSLPISTWTLLTTSIKEYQTGLARYATRIYLRMIMPIYMAWFLSLFVFDLETVHRSLNYHPGYIAMYYLSLIGLITLAACVACQYKQYHVDQVFLPAVQTVLTELQPKLTEAGFEVALMVETGQWFGKPSRAFLRFRPLNTGGDGGGGGDLEDPRSAMMN